MSWVLVALMLTAAPPSRALPVRLAPVTCPGLSDGDLRAALRVELRDRLAVETAPAPPDFALVSVACAGDGIDLMIVHQSSGAPVRRHVPLAEAAPDARPRVAAIAVAELLRVDAVRAEPPAVRAAAPPAPPPPARVFVLGGTPLLLGGYFSGPKAYWTIGVQLRLALQQALDPRRGPRWGWGVAVGIDDAMSGASNRNNVAGTAAALVRRQGAVFTWELGLGGRFGRAWDYSLGASPPAANIFGPFGSLALEARVQAHSISRISLEGGSDSGPLGGGWARVVLGGGIVF